MASMPITPEQAIITSIGLACTAIQLAVVFVRNILMLPPEEDADDTMSDSSSDSSMDDTITPMSLCSSLQSSNTSPWYIRPRSTQWWDQFITVVTPSDYCRWPAFFRISKQMFDCIVDLVTPDMQQLVIPLGLRKIPGRELQVQKQVAIALARLAHGSSMFELSELFGVGLSTVSRVTQTFVKSLQRRASHFLQWPTTDDEWGRIKASFEGMQGLPNVCGAIDCTHICMELPQDACSEDFYDENGSYSIILQAVVDMDMRFLDINVGWPGSVNDAWVLSNSALYHKVEGGQWLTGDAINIRGFMMREYIIGDAEYPLLPWLITPFVGPQTEQHEMFNHRHRSTWIVVERAFGRLKNRWRILHGCIRKPNLKLLPSLVHACCILHNMSIQLDGNIPLQGDNELQDDVNADMHIHRQSGTAGANARLSLMTYLSQL